MSETNFVLFVPVSFLSSLNYAVLLEDYEYYSEINGVDAFKLIMRRNNILLLLECLPEQLIATTNDLIDFIKGKERISFLILKPFAEVFNLFEPVVLPKFYFIKMNELVSGKRSGILELLFNHSIVEHIRSKLLKENEGQKDITIQKLNNSIDYAKRIQQGLFINQDVFKLFFPDSFLLESPKDKLSGDFYWINISNSYKFLIVCDCTGHGVPGSLLTIIGYTLLNNIILSQRTTEPYQIINQLNREWLKLFNPNKMNSIKDGMTISVVRFDESESRLTCASSGSYIYLINNQGVLTECVSNKADIGSFIRHEDLKENAILPYTKGDNLYLSTDGFTDQIGGMDFNTKFSRKKLKGTLSEICNYSMQEQTFLLRKEHREWRSKIAQTDDILMIGMKF